MSQRRRRPNHGRGSFIPPPVGDQQTGSSASSASSSQKPAQQKRNRKVVSEKFKLPKIVQTRRLSHDASLRRIPPVRWELQDLDSSLVPRPAFGRRIDGRRVALPDISRPELVGQEVYSIRKNPQRQSGSPLKGRVQFGIGEHIERSNSNSSVDSATLTEREEALRVVQRWQRDHSRFQQIPAPGMTPNSPGKSHIIRKRRED